MRRGVTKALARPSLRVLVLVSCPGITAAVLDGIHASPGVNEVVVDPRPWLTPAAIEGLFQRGIHVRREDPSHPLADTAAWSKRYPRREGEGAKR